MGAAPRVTGVCFPKTITANGDTILAMRELMNQTVTRYQTDGFNLPAEPGSVGYTAFQDRLTQIFCDFPILGQQALPVTCASYTSEQVANNPYLVPLCGCYLPASQYQDFVPAECATICNNSIAVKRTNVNNQTIDCPSDVCVINGVSIAVENSTGGEVTINQSCAGCAGSCDCYIGNNTIDIINSSGVNVNINELCGTVVCGDGQVCEGGNKLRLRVLALIMTIIALVLVIAVAVWAMRRENE